MEQPARKRRPSLPRAAVLPVPMGRQALAAALLIAGGALVPGSILAGILLVLLGQPDAA